MQPKAKFRKDYRAPDFTITEIYLDIQLDADRTFVTSVLNVERKTEGATHLKLDGHSFDFLSLKLNGQEHVEFERDEESLTVNVAEQADKFQLQIETALNPAKHLIAGLVSVGRWNLYAVRGRRLPSNYLYARQTRRTCKISHKNHRE